MDTRNVIKTFIISNFLKGDKSITFRDDSFFIEEGIIDSIGVLELTAFIEETFHFRVEDEELVPENFDSINNLVVYVNSKLTDKRS
jgi:acyl carrier protein